MGNSLRLARCIAIVLLAAGIGCAAQTTPAANSLPAKLNRQIELTIRSQYNVPPDYTVTLGQRGKSDISGYDTLPVSFSNGTHKKTLSFLISKDNNTLARLEKFDLANNPASHINILGRPIRGNPKAKVTIISFDDLECPFCARMNALLFPATEKHYGNQVRFIYKDYPLPFHPWAMHAAVDVNCLAAQSHAGYWNMVDYIHDHDTEISGDQRQPDLSASFKKLDDATRAEGVRQKVDTGKLDACIVKQDTSGIRDSIHQGDLLGIDGTPTLFVNGERAVGALSQQALWTIVDRAIRDAGEVPPPQGNNASGTSSATPGN